MADRPPSSTSRLGLGTIVRHPMFGTGRIVAYESERYVIVFPGGEIKRVAFSFDGMQAERPAGDPEMDRIKQAVHEVLNDHG